MWQLCLRYDTIDLDDGAVEGGKMDTWTAGVNWYWRSNFKFMLNYVKVDSERQGLDDDPSIGEARAQFYCYPVDAGAGGEPARCTVYGTTLSYLAGLRARIFVLSSA